MPAKSPICVARRRHLSTLACTSLIGFLSGCTAPTRLAPNTTLPRQKPQLLAMLPSKAVSEVRLEHLSSARNSSAWSAGMSRTALWDNQSSRSRDFTRVLKQNGLAATSYLKQQLMANAAAKNIDLAGLTSTAAIETAVSDWSFDALASNADAVVYLEISDIAFSSLRASTFWPILHTTMTVASTRDNAQLGEQDYQIRINAEPTDQRDNRPGPLGRFQSANELMANPRLVVKSLHAELDKIAELMASDLEKLTRGKEMKWGSV